MIRARLSPTFGQVLPRLLEVAQRPRKLAEGIGGALQLNLTYILCLMACVAAFGGPIPVVKIALVYLTRVTIGSVIPTPGGLGAVEAALTAGLTAAACRAPRQSARCCCSGCSPSGFRYPPAGRR